MYINESEGYNVRICMYIGRIDVLGICFNILFEIYEYERICLKM